MPNRIIITSGNKGIGIINVFKNLDGTVKDITGYTCNVDVVYPNRTSENLPVEVTDATAGKVLLILDTAQTIQYGQHRLYFNLVDSNSYITAQDIIIYQVIKAKGGTQ